MSGARQPADRNAAGRDRFPGFDALSQSGHWDPVTTGVVASRLGLPPDLRFFTPSEQAVLTALADRLLDQDAATRLPVVAQVDARLAERQTDGWHYQDLPEDGTAWRDSLADLDAEALTAYGLRHLRTARAGPVDPGHPGPRLRRLARPARRAGVESVDPLPVHRVLRPPRGVERDRLPRSGLSARLQESRR